MKNYSITKTITIWGGLARFVAVWFVALFIFAGLFGGSDSSGVNIIVGATIAACGWAYVFYFVTYRKVKRHSKEVLVYAQKHELEIQPETTIISDVFRGVAISKIYGARDAQCRNTIKAKDWDYADISYKIYRKGKNSEYHTATIYYSAASIKLSRKLPHVFFDSNSARKKQFKFVFAGNQKLSFEGDFDDHFTSYCPGGYTIDTLSFITPEVMEALIDAKDYDIELLGDRLYLYSSLKNPEKQIDDMISKLDNIRKKIADNIDTYRDDRLPGFEGKNSVSIEGVSLKKSRFWPIVSIIFFIAIILAYLSPIIISSFR